MLRDTETRLRPSWLLLGPAFVAAIAYVDPGNVAANVSAGAQFGFLLVWVIFLANAMAGLVQYLSAKLGLVSGRTLPEAIADTPAHRPGSRYWLQAELVAMATDLAEVVGGAIALLSAVRPAAADRRRHHRRGVAAPAGGAEPPRPADVRAGHQRPAADHRDRIPHQPVRRAATARATPPRAWCRAFDGAESVLLATAMLGATVMPHAVYLHSGLARDRHGHPEAGPQRSWLLRVTRIDVGLAMLVAGAVNLSMVLVAATNLQGRDDTDSIEGAHAAVRDTLGPTVALFFAIGLLASGLASTSVGAYAGAMIMQGLLKRSYPLLLRRLVTLIPALVVLAIGVDPSRALVISQVVLSFGIPFALVPLIRLTSNRALMGDDTNHRVTSALGWMVATMIILLNVVLIYLTVTG